ncbi:hypothetical protein R4R77_000472 [Citrobacter amalonaticus]|uniref:PAAR domain-containing protein n=1 Tax=Citrobacter amalonaticus TaxID=35703 RepID=A0AAW9M0U1_CITAM|nr:MULTISPECIES: hypothetical protein [Citrobacter]ELR9580889.1 hypothetical protein [Citrobacter amalonaticus]MDV2137623.1 hypothetical protein [Citrobacter amalonaticus]MEB0585129.1 hypothetical protein [Citrobacter amalonaticus]MZK95251.1 hypothetical protein [Citrobacter amalonaticus]MZL22487.1 hypothetical protein [Citrobacter amalonaticus]
MRAFNKRSEGFLLAPGDRTSCGGYILKSKEYNMLDGMEIVYEMDEYICGMNGQKYEIKGGVPKGSWIERGENLFRRTNASSWDSSIDSEGRKVEPPSVSIKRLNEEKFLYRRNPDSLRNFENGFGFEHNRFLGRAGGTINLKKKIIVNDEKEDGFSHRTSGFPFRTRISHELYNHYLTMGHDMSQYETEIICLLAGSAHSRGTCPCHCRFIPHLNITYRYDNYILASYESANRSQNSTPLAPATRKISESRQSVEPGFCVVPELTTPKSYEYELMVNPPSGVKELYHQLNPEKKKKPGSILVVADPLSRSPEKIAQVQTARDKIDKALEPLTNEEAKLLYENRTSIDIFSSNLYSDALGQSGDILGYIKDAGGEYYEEINKILNEIQELYKKTYSQNSGRISGEEFFGQRERLFKKLDGILNKFSKEQLNLKQYEQIKQALGLSTKSIMHKWDQTGVKDIEGYASYIEKSAKLMKIMRTTGFIGIGLDFASYTTTVYDACAKGRESECRKAAITEYSKFGGKQTASVAGGAVGGIMGRAACTWVLGLITSESGGIGAGLCLVTGIGSSIAGGKIAEKWGEIYGKKIGTTMNDKIDRSEPIIRDPDSFNEEAGALLYEKLFNH